MDKKSSPKAFSRFRRTGAEGGIRTPARFYPPTPLAGEPLIATWVLLQVLYHLKPYVPKKVAERVGFEPTALDESPVFKTGSLNHSDISPHLFQSEANKMIPHITDSVNPPEPAFLRKQLVPLTNVSRTLLLPHAPGSRSHPRGPARTPL